LDTGAGGSKRPDGGFGGRGMQQEVVVNGMRFGAEYRLGGIALQLHVAELVAVAKFPAPAIADVLANPGAHHYVGLELGGGRVGSQLHILGSIETSAGARAEFP